MDSTSEEGSQVVKSLVRGLDVLAAMNDLSLVTVSGLVRETGFPKATVIRLLKTLVSQGYAVELDNGTGYRVTSRVLSLSRAMNAAESDRLVAERSLKYVTEALKWPCEWMIRDNDAMVTTATTRDSAPISLPLFQRRRVNILHSAAGIAWLSGMTPERTRSTLAEITLHLNTPEDIAGVTARIDEARERGYALLETNGQTQGLSIIAMPVIRDITPLGTITLPHFSAYVTDAVRESLVLPTLRKAAEDIASSLVHSTASGAS